MTDNFVAGSRQNYLVNGSGTRLAAANPADPLANLSLASWAIRPTRTAARRHVGLPGRREHLLPAGRPAAARRRLRRPRLRPGVTTGGKTWLQYWLFSYYNPQNVLGFGVHEGDWEFIQVGLNADGAPDVATYAQHDGGERCAWSQVQKSAGAPVVYVALASHASYFSSGVNPRGLYPDDYHRGGGYQVAAGAGNRHRRPRRSWPGAASGARRRRAPSRRDGRASGAIPTASTPLPARARSGAAQSSATANARGSGAEVASREITVTRGGTLALRALPLPDARHAPPLTLLISVARAGAPDVAAARRIRVVPQRRRVAAPAARPAGPYVVSASAFSERGARSPIVAHTLP